MNRINEPIAIIGMACRYPGANSPQALWQLVRDGATPIGEVPPERWDINRYYHPTPSTPGKIMSRNGGFLHGLDQFDAQFFSISPREAPHIDPRQRVMLEVAWEALEDAGIPPDSLAGSKTSVYVSTLRNDYGSLMHESNENIRIYTGPGTANSVVANRLSYVLDLRGSSVALDTACSGSLVALNLARHSLQSGESTLALVGGISINLLPNGDLFFSQAGALAIDGRCKTFDHRANGIVRSEGAGLIVLKPLSQAEADGDRIYALIRGSVVNQDGRSNGIMAPNGKAQEAMLVEAYQQAGISPAKVQYIEAHGTGTSLGDPIEANAIGAILSQGRTPEDQNCILGSIKTNIGHTESAAGMAGIIKTVYSMIHRVIPGTLHFEKPNPKIRFDEFPLEVRSELGPWPNPSQPLIAGVSSFGFGGTNAHAVLQEASPEAPATPSTFGAYLLPLSARTPEALRALAEAYQQRLSDDDSLTLHDICYTASLRRAHLEERLALVVHSKEELRENLAAYLAGESRSGLSATPDLISQAGKLAFIFSGQGSHWFQMGCELVEKEAVFRAALEKCDELLREHVSWSLLTELSAREGESRLNDTDVTQPAIFAIQVSLAALWQSWGIVPDVVVGHSLGEVAAAHVAGILTLEEAVKVVVHRSRLMKTLEGKGKTAVVGLSLAEAREVIKGQDTLLSVAGSNSPTTSVLAGEPTALKRVLEGLEAEGVFCRLLRGVNIAFHSPQMEPLKSELVERLADMSPRPASIPIFSTVTGTLLDGTAFDASYWGRNLRDPFLFTEVMERLLDNGYHTLLEVSPHPVLSPAILQALHHTKQEGTVLCSLRRREEGRLNLLTSLATLYTRGYAAEWAALYPTKGKVISLPTYPWQREHYWIDQLTNTSHTTTRKTGSHPLLGEHLKLAVAQQHIWEADLDAQTPHYLADHRILGSVMLPAAAYLEMAQAAAKQVGLNPVVEEATFEQALRLPDNTDQRCRVQMLLSPTGGGKATFQLYSQTTNGQESSEDWTLHVTGQVGSGNALSNGHKGSLAEIKARCTEVASVEEHYEIMQSRGLIYGPTFRAFKQVWRGNGEAFAQLELPATLTGSAYTLHPVLLDTCFQSVAQTGLSADEIYLPHSVKSWRVYHQPEKRLWCHTRLRGETAAKILEADIDLFNDAGQVIAEVEGLRLERVDGTQQGKPRKITDWLLDMQWQVQARADKTSPSDAGKWLIFSDRQMGKALAAELSEHGDECVLVYAAESYQASAQTKEYWLNPARSEQMERLFEEVLTHSERPWRGIVYLWGLEMRDYSPAALQKGIRLSNDGMLNIIRTLTRTSPQESGLRLWLVTQNAQAVIDTSQAISYPQSMIWGFGRVIGLELGEFWGGLVDLDAGERAAQAALLCEALRTPDDEQQIAFRKGERYVARLTPYQGTSPQPFSLNVNGSYLITGGLSGLGLLVAQWMVEQGARRLILLGRTPLPPRSTWRQLEPEDPAASRVAAIQELERMGASIHFASLDVANDAQLADFLQQYRQQGYPPIRGVVHSAGLIRDKLLIQMDDESFYNVLRPKINGAWALHRATQKDPLDFFILFSSINALVGQYGQANYASANAFMDGLAHYRRARGLPALSINWGPWAEVGMFARLDSEVKQQVMAVIPPKEGMRIFAHLLEQNPTQIAVVRANWQYMPPSTLLSELVVEQAERGAEPAASDEANMMMLELLLAPPAEREAIIEAELAEMVSKVLQLDPSRLTGRKPLASLGMDSLMAVELRQQIERGLGLSVSMASLFTASVAELAAQLADQLAGDDDKLAELLSEIEALSMDEVEELLEA